MFGVGFLLAKEQRQFGLSQIHLMQAATEVKKQKEPWMLSRWWNWERTSGKFLIISIAAHALFGIIAAVFVVQHIQTARKLTFKGGPPSPNPSTRDRKSNTSELQSLTN